MKRQKRGFSILFDKKFNTAKYTVYFEEKEKVIYCIIYDGYFGLDFKAKAVCHSQDEYSKFIGYKLAFERCLEKRDLEYEREIKNVITNITMMKNKNQNIEYKFNKFLKKLINSTN